MSGEKTDGDGQNAISGYIAECKQRGIPILPPNINTSGADFVALPDGIHYRITTIKHVGDSAIDHIRELRPITSFEDYLLRHDKSKCNKAVTINLIKAGAFDFDNENRAELLWQYDMSKRTKTQIKNDYQCEPYLWNDNVKMAWEKEVLGMYLSLHPMERYGFRSLDEYEDGVRGKALQGGEVTEVYAFHPRKDPKNPKMAWITLNTLFGTIKVVVFARDYARQDVQSLFQTGNIVLIRGTKQGKELLFDSGEILEENRG
jgi:DNA polymerase-3 subunit alpha